MPDLGQVAYAGYLACTAGLDHRGEPCPMWADLAPETREAWRAAADAVRMVGWDAVNLARATGLLIEHQRRDITGCGCGWSELGKCHSRHVAGELAAAGLLRDGG